MYIYADNAATTRLGAAARNAMLPYLDELYANPSSLYSTGQKAKEAISKAREDVARATGALHSSEITFTSGGSESDNQAIISAAVSGAKAGKKHIVSAAFEHHAVLHTLEKLRSYGFDITLVNPDRNALINTDDIKKALRKDTALVSVMYANNETGTVQPVSEIGALCRERGILFHTDAVQAAGHLHIDVEKQNIDLLSISAHKFHGPKGAGALYARKGTALVRLIEGGGQEKGRRAGTENVMGIAGLAAALKDSVSKIDYNIHYVSFLRDKIISGLLEIPDSFLNGDRVKRLPGNINISFKGIEGDSLILMLDKKGIAASSGSACTSASPLPSHVLLSAGVPEDVARGSLRLTLSEYNTQEEADYIIKAVRDCVYELRSTPPAWGK